MNKKKRLAFLLTILFALIVVFLYINFIPNNLYIRQVRNGLKSSFPQGKNIAKRFYANYQNLINPSGKTIAERIKTPEEYERVPAFKGSFSEYVRNLPLKPHGSKVHYYNGKEKFNDVYVAVVDIDVGDRDLQQCADAAIRLYTEYLYKNKQYDKIHFNFTNGFRADFRKWMEGYRIKVEGNRAYWVKQTGYCDDYKCFRWYLNMVFAYAGTFSLLRELKKVPLKDMQIGDVFLDAGHCVIIVDIAQNKKTGEKIFLLAQSYMPAQEIHVLKNPANDDENNPWYSINFGDVLITPEWQFEKESVYRFGE